MIIFLVVSLAVVGLAVALLFARDWAKGEHPGFWSHDATRRARKQIEIAGRTGIIRVSRRWL